MFSIQLSHIVIHIALICGCLLLLVHIAVTTGQLEVKKDAESHNKLLVKLTYNGSEGLTVESITEADYQSNCFCRAGTNTPLYNCETSLNYEKIVDITWSNRNVIIRRKPDCSSDSTYSFNVTTTNIQVGLERNEDGDELNVTLVCVDTFNHIYVNDESQQADRIRLEFSKQSGNDNVILRFLRSEKRLVSGVVNRIWSYFSSSTDNNNGIRFNCGDAIITTTSSAQSDSTVHVNPTPETTISSSTKPTTTSTTTPNTNPVPETTITSTTKPTTTSTTIPNTNPTPETTIDSTTRPAIPSATTLKTNSTTNQNSTEHTNEQDLVLMVVIPVVAVVVIIVVIIIVGVIRVSGKSPSVNEGGDYEGLANNRTSARVYAELNQINDENPNQPGSIEMNYENFPPAPYYENVPTLTQATVDPTADAYESID